MAKSSAKKDEKKELPGVPMERFEAGVRTLVDLRDRGKFLVFLARRRSAQMIGLEADFLEELSKQLSGEKLELKDAQDVLEEIRRFLAARIGMGDLKRVVTFFLRSLYEEEIKNLEPDAKKQFREQLEKKAALVEQQLHTIALQSRDERFGGATGACLEDLEFELVGERHTASKKESFSDPFLRLKIRYTKGTEPSPGTLSIFFNFFPPINFSGGEHSFELECDESDIDLLMLRLAVAKQRLLQAREQNSNG